MRSRGRQTLSVGGVQQVAPALLTTVRSDPFELENVVKMGLELTATSDGDVDVAITLEISNDGVNFAIEDGYSDIINITDETAHRKTVYDTALPAAKWGRLAFTGQNTNDASTVVAGDLNLIRDEK